MISIRGRLQEIAVRSHLKKYRFDSIVYLLACDLLSIISGAEDQRSSGYNRNHLLSKLWVLLASDTVVLLPTGDRRASFATGSSSVLRDANHVFIRSSTRLWFTIPN